MTIGRRNGKESIKAAVSSVRQDRHLQTWCYPLSFVSILRNGQDPPAECMPAEGGTALRSSDSVIRQYERSRGEPTRRAVSCTREEERLKILRMQKQKANAFLAERPTSSSMVTHQLTKAGMLAAMAASEG